MTTTELNDKELAFLSHLESSMQDMDDLPGGLQALIYGDSGAGKTVTAMMLAAAITPADKTILFVDTSQGYKVRKNHPKLMQRSFKRIPFGGIAELNKMSEFIEKKVSFLSEIGAVIFDESTTMASEDLQRVVQMRSKFKQPDADPMATTQPDFGAAQNRFTDMVSRYAKLDGIHCIHIGHVRTDAMPNGGVQFSPSYTPKLGAVLRQPMDLVTYLTVNEDGERMFRNHPMKGIVAKSRVKDLDPLANFSELVMKTKNWLENEKAEPDQANSIDPMDHEETALEI